MRCPACHATNPQDASWCNLCYARLRATPPIAVSSRHAPAADAAVPVEPAAVAADPVRPEVGSITPDATTTLAQRGFRRRDGELEWECPSCALFNRIDDLECAACGAALSDRYRGADQPPAPNASTALILSAVAPGAGHLAVGQYGSGLARVLLYVLWLAGGVALAVSGGAAALPGATPLLAGALLLWCASLYDLVALSRGGRQALEGRVFLWLVVGVTLLSLFGVVGAGVAGAR